MKIQVASNLNKEKIASEIKDAVIVDTGDYILYENNSRVRVSDGYELQYLPLASVYVVETINGVNTVFTENSSYTSSQNLQSMETLPLIRINKSTLINIEHIQDIKVRLNMKYSLRIHNRWLEVNRTYYYQFKEAIGL